MAGDVVCYHSGMLGSPAPGLGALGGIDITPGSMLRVLDACLVNGFNAISIVALTQVGGTASCTTQGGHNFSVGEYIEILGASPSGYVGRFKVLTRTATGFTFAVDSGLASPAAGAMTARHPPAGWSHAFRFGNDAAYTTGAGSAGNTVQIEDNNQAGGNMMRTRMIVAFGGALDTGTQLGEQLVFYKSAGTWVLIADAKTAYVIMASTYVFLLGEFKSYVAGDQYPNFLARGQNVPQQGGYNFYYGCNRTGFTNTGSTYHGMYGPLIHGYPTINYCQTMNVLRQSNGVGTERPAGAAFLTAGTYHAYSANAQMMLPVQAGVNTPNLADGTVPLTPIMIIEYDSTSAMGARGLFRGMYLPVGLMNEGLFGSHNQQYLDNAIVDGTPRRVVVCRCGPASYSQLAIDVDGPWS